MVLLCVCYLTLTNGIKLFDEIDNEIKLDLVQTIRSNSGIVELVYEHRSNGR